MLPMSPPLPLIHKTVALLPSSGSVPSILELVFPPPKFVMRRSDPNKLDRYLSNSAPSRVLATWSSQRSEEHTSELQSRFDLVCRLLLEKKKIVYHSRANHSTHQCTPDSETTHEEHPTQ